MRRTRPKDPNQRAKSIVDESTSETEEPVGAPSVNLVNKEDGKNPAAVALGRLGGLKGGRARAEKLSAEERSEIARKAAEARWKPGKR